MKKDLDDFNMLTTKQFEKIEKLLMEDLRTELDLNSTYTCTEIDHIVSYWGNEMVFLKEDIIPFFDDEGEWDIQGIERMFNKHSEPLGDEFVSAKILCKDKNSYITIED